MHVSIYTYVGIFVINVVCFFFSSGTPDFSEVYSFIGSVFDPESKGHVQKLKEMDPINFETVSHDNELMIRFIIYFKKNCRK